jgi:hypothetical protein
MQTTRFWVLACLAVFVSALSFSCGSDEIARPTKPACPSCGGDMSLGGESFAGGPSVHAGGSGTSGSRAMPSGGDEGVPLGGSGAVAGNAGTGATGASGAGEGGASGGTGGAPTNPGGEQLEVCGRLTMTSVHAFAVAEAYEKAVFRDCQVKWVAALQGQDLVDYKNTLLLWNRSFWGCPDAPVFDNTFALVFKTPPLTQGDADVLIDHYLAAAQAELDLSPPEAADMRAALERLAAPLITDPSLEPSNSSCSTDGAGGAGSAGAPP